MSNDYSQLKGIPKQLLPNRIRSIQVIKGGLNNRNILLNNSILIKNYLERDESNDPVYLRFLREKNAFQNLKQRNYLPKLLKTSESKNQLYLSRKWLDGDILSLSDIQENPHALIYPLVQLHSESYFSEGDFKYFDVITRYLKEYQINKQHIPKEFPEFSILEAFFKKNSSSIDSSESVQTQTRIHGDLVFSNIICPKDYEYCNFIDWEYTTTGTPLIDLAYLFTQNSVPEQTQKKILSLYCQFSGQILDENLLNIYKQLMIFMSALWYALQAIRMKKGFLTHTHTSLSVGEFQDLAEKSFQNLKNL